MSKDQLNETEQILVHTARSVILIAILFMVCSAILISVFLWNGQEKNKTTVPVIAQTAIPAGTHTARQDWKAPDENTIPEGKAGEMIRYGRDLIVNTSEYFGPNGSVAAITNGMNCQNCHLQAGTKTFANNYAVFFASYPKKSNRDGRIVPASNRIAECFERSLAGNSPDTSSQEIQAMLAYLKWVGSAVKKGEHIFGTAFEKLGYMDRLADPQRGKVLYTSKCVSCHGPHGEGILSVDKGIYIYPPLWGEHSYNDAAGMYRISDFAGFIKNNMPFGANFKTPLLTDEESWDIAAFVNSQPRKHKDQQKDYPDLAKKPIDSPFGPYADQFTSAQHKYGPYKPIADYYKSYKKQ